MLSAKKFVKLGEGGSWGYVFVFSSFFFFLFCFCFGLLFFCAAGGRKGVEGVGELKRDVEVCSQFSWRVGVCVCHSVCRSHRLCWLCLSCLSS